jgi:MFS family permease
MAADWLQGPYIYALYEDYGFGKSDIALLFICGFFSSMVFGTFVGAVADKYGRKTMSVLFGVFYSLSCITKLWNDFYILMLGRILSGVATSLLFSVFEAWMVYEHNKRGFSAEGLSQTFSYATFGNGIVAILSGLASSAVADHFGYVAPFMMALGLLVLGSIIVFVSWTENYGDTSVDVSGTFSNAINALKSDSKVIILGIVQSLFEASMYTFVFMWTPALQEEEAGKSAEPLPFGLIFATYMVAIMIGSSVFKILAVRFHVVPESLGKFIFGIAAAALFVPVIASNKYLITIAFITFEAMCGMYFPCMGTLRGKYIPEASRSAIMNIFRVPLNLLVVLVLLKVSLLANSTVFLVCTIWLIMAAVLHVKFVTSLRTFPYPSTNNIAEEGKELLERA